MDEQTPVAPADSTVDARATIAARMPAGMDIAIRDSLMRFALGIERQKSMKRVMGGVLSHKSKPVAEQSQKNRPLHACSQDVADAILANIMERHFYSGNYQTAEITRGDLEAEKLDMKRYAVPKINIPLPEVPTDDSVKPAVNYYMELLGQAEEVIQALPTDAPGKDQVLARLEAHRTLMQSFLDGGKDAMLATIRTPGNLQLNRPRQRFKER